MKQAADDVTGQEGQTSEEQRDDSLEILQAEQDAAETGDQVAESGTAGEDDEVVVSIGGESPAPEDDESRAPEWVRELRKSNREKDRKLRELEQENVRLKGVGQVPAAVVVGDKPTLESCSYDATKFEAELEAWHQRKKDADTQQAQIAEVHKKQQDAWQARLTVYSTGKSALKVKDYEDAEDAVKGTLNVVQQGVILQGADNPAVVVYALGKNPAKAKELAAIADPVKFAFAVAKLETQLKVTPKKAVPAPERRVSSSVPGAAVVDNQLEKLRAEAAKTGDLSRVIAFKRQQKASRGN